MHNWRFKAAALVAVPVLAVTVGACGEANDGGSGGAGEGASGLSGSIRVDGSSTVGPLTAAAAEFFNEDNPDVKVTVGTSGTGGGFEKFCAGETEISDASRPIKDEEKAACKEGGVEFTEVQVANDGLTIVVNKDNPVKCLTVEQLNEIYAPDAKITKWSEIKGLKEPFDEPLDIYSPGEDSGTFDYFTDAVLDTDKEQRTGGVNVIGENDNQGITGVGGSKGGIFYVGFSYYQENQDKLKALEIDGGEGCVAPSLEGVQDASYSPLGRPLFIYPSNKAMEQEHVKAFVDFYLETQAEITEETGFIPMTDEQVAKASEAVKG